MSNRKHSIKMHACESAFRRRNSFLHEANGADEAIEADEVVEADGADENGEINRRSD